MPHRTSWIPRATALLLGVLLGSACDLPEPDHPHGAPEVRVVHAALQGRVDVLGVAAAKPIVILRTLETSLLVMPNAMQARVAAFAGRDVEVAGLVVIEAGRPAAIFATEARARPGFHERAATPPFRGRERSL